MTQNNVEKIKNVSQSQDLCCCKNKQTNKRTKQGWKNKKKKYQALHNHVPLAARQPCCHTERMSVDAIVLNMDMSLTPIYFLRDLIVRTFEFLLLLDFVSPPLSASFFSQIRFTSHIHNNLWLYANYLKPKASKRRVNELEHRPGPSPDVGK